MLYPLATSILLLCDGGGSNSARTYLFKEALQNLSNELGIELRIAHYPPYTSKYNPIEHRLFPHVSRVCEGVIFDSVETVRELMATATTKTGLEVFTTILGRSTRLGRKQLRSSNRTCQLFSMISCLNGTIRHCHSKLDFDKLLNP